MLLSSQKKAKLKFRWQKKSKKKIASLRWKW